MFRAKLAQRPFDSRYRQVVDLEMWCYLLRSGDLVYTSEPLCHFRCHRDQQTEANRQLALGNREQIYLLQNSLEPFLTRGRSFSLADRKHLFSTLFHVRKGKDLCSDSRLIEETLMPLLGKKWYAAYWLRHRITRPVENIRRAWKKHLFKGARG